MQEFFSQVETTLGPLWPIVLFLLIVLASYIVAKMVASVVRSGLRRTQLDDKLFASFTGPQSKLTSEGISGAITFWVVFVLGLIVAFDVVNLRAVSGPLGTFVDRVLGFVPDLVGALLLGVVAYAIAKLLGTLTTKALEVARIDERVASATHEPEDDIAWDAPEPAVASPTVERTSLAQTLGTAVFYLVLLLFLPGILGILELGGILVPVQNLVNEILAFLPNLLLAGIVLVVGVFVARILRKIVGSLTDAAGINQLSERVGLARATGGTRLSDLLGLVVYILVLIPVIVAALNALNVDAVTAPASAMLAQVMEAIPRVFVAALILGIAYVVGRLVASLVSNLLAGVGFDRMFEGLGFRQAAREATAPTDPGAAAEAGVLDTSRPSGIVGIVVLVAVMLFAATEASASLGFEALALLIVQFTELAGQILLGLVIFAVGLYLANLAYSMVQTSGTSQAATLAVAARVSILVLAGAMALKQMGLADSIVNLAFGLILGAIALAAAIAFGWGGRDAAKRQIEKLQHQLEDGGAPNVLKPSADAPGASPQTRPDLSSGTPGS